MRTTLFICLMALLGVPRSVAQVPARAQRWYNEALKEQQKRRPQKAEAAMRKAIASYPPYTEAYSTLGRWLYDAHQFRAAATLFLTAEGAVKDGAKLFQKAAAMSLISSGDLAVGLQRIPPNTTDSGYVRLRRQAQFMQAAMAAAKQDSLVVMPVGIPQRINTRDPELFPFLSADGSTLYFTRRVNGMDDDIYYALRDSCGGWLGARNIGSPANSSAQESSAALSADRHYLFMMRCDNRSENGWSQGGCDLYMAYTADSLWSTPLSFGATINTPDFEGMPSLSSDNRELFFVSNRPGGYGGTDIWSSRFEHGLWQLPRNLGPQINTDGNETAPFIYADNQTLYFSSNGHTGMGGNDLFVSRRVNDTTWSTPVNLGFPLNTVFDESSISLDAAGDTLFIASDRDSAAGDFNLYQAAVPAGLKPQPVVVYEGFVYDSLSKAPLNYANIYFTDSASGREVHHAVSNRGDGSYMIALAAGHTYQLVASRIGYQQLDDRIACDTAGLQAIKHHFAMLPFGYEKPVKDSLLLRIFFKKNVIAISDSDQAVLTTILQPWAGKQGVQIMINGYTDNSGTPMLNEQLSYTRANAAAALLRQAGVPEEQISVQGWGEANPLAENDTEQHRDENRRIELLIRQ